MSLAGTPDFSRATTLSDEQLVLLVIAGDHQAFSNLYERYFKRIYNFVSRRLNNTADVEETVQEVFINVFASVGSYRQDAPFSAWIFGIARRTIASRFKKKRHPTVSLEAEGSDPSSADWTLVSSDPTAIETIECNQRVKSIKRLVKNRLTQEQRILFELHHLQDRPIQEIARTLNMSENAVKSNLYRARKILRNH
ncbi:MAG: RNA polymerase sigma factor [Deltaproteobacteria bacterium]|nr:RNA polymerase sigma factor [Deltaproteobacteria bacterium]MBW2723268.1 RNA polymerase sigma factor [Deltaproteobacteria bacterium]